MKKNKKQYSLGKISKLWDFLVKLHEKNPQAFGNADLLRSMVAASWTDLKDGHRCPNCQASMAMYRRKVDYHVASLLISMARIVRGRLEKGIPFTEANKIHVNGEDTIPHVEKNNITIARHLGLAAPVDDEQAHWVITSRGFAALRGERIPATVVTFRNSIIGRGEETTTFAEAMSKKKGEGGRDYNPRDWAEIEGFSTNAIL